MVGTRVKSPVAVAALAALAHEHRLAIYRMLVEAGTEGLPAGVIAARLKVPPSSLTFHLQNLQRVGLITQQRMSRQLIYAADFTVMNDLVAYLTENCCAQSASESDCARECAPTASPSRARKYRRAV
jgi:DNA-binding transcriptional ArsR family regulator